MKILKANAGILTNFEVLNLLKSRGASKDPLRDVRSNVSYSELKVFDYLVETAACNQSKECIDEFVEKCAKFNLAKAEILNIINLRPSMLSEIFPIIEEFDARVENTADELVELVINVLPPPPTNAEEVKEENSNTESMEGIESNKVENLIGGMEALKQLEGMEALKLEDLNDEETDAS